MIELKVELLDGASRAYSAVRVVATAFCTKREVGAISNRFADFFEALSDSREPSGDEIRAALLHAFGEPLPSGHRSVEELPEGFSHWRDSHGMTHFTWVKRARSRMVCALQVLRRPSDPNGHPIGGPRWTFKALGNPEKVVSGMSKIFPEHAGKFSR